MSQARAEQAPTESAINYVDLLGNATFPEGILSLPNGRLMVGGFGDGSLQLVDVDASPPSSYFSAPGENGMALAVGFAYDENRDWLWVANFNFDTGNGIPGSNLKIFSLGDETLVATLPSEDFVPGVFFNELAMTDDGTVYVTDTFNPSIYTASPDNLTAVEEFVTDPLLTNPAEGQPFGLNGLALSPDGKYLIASVMDRLDAGDGRLVRISIDDESVADVALLASVDTPAAVDAFAGSDGMFFMSPVDTPDGSERTLIMVNVYSPAGAIMTADFSEDYSTATLTILDPSMDEGAVEVSTDAKPIYDRPTASAVLGDKLWTVNSQLDHIIDDANGALNTPFDVPFQIVGVPLSKLFVVASDEETMEPKEETPEAENADDSAAFIVAFWASAFTMTAALSTLVAI